jgi:hypothetical protein
VSSVNPSPLLGINAYADGIYIPYSTAIYVAKEYYTKCLSDTEKSQLLQTLAHEALHVYLDQQVGTANYLQYDNRSGFHDWIHATAAAIASYYGMGVAGSSPPSINTYPDVFFDPND